MSFACPETGERVTLVRVAQTGLSALTLVVGLHAGRLISVLLEIVLVYLADQVCGQVGLLFVCVVKKRLVIGAQLALVALDHVIGHPVSNKRPHSGHARLCRFMAVLWLNLKLTSIKLRLTSWEHLIEYCNFSKLKELSRSRPDWSASPILDFAYFSLSILK
ncbi:hypothetical protein BpHYR1_025130 [Brachionus plicatilis]|uniref:Uncharacterized protein n=1 Tax=Brachionus plicatilis TaxID=10195 RepID=A0A3M7RSI7_BRAPC|nr:hypothetical protein BpHYR1_025130 [Brachionus plicatilis]